MGELATAYTRGEVKREEIGKKLAELRKTRSARRQARLQELRRELGSDVLERSDVQAELAKHHRRIALLERARFVAETELDGFRRAKALVHIERLRTFEDERFEPRLQGLKHRLAAERNPSAPPSSSSSAEKASAE